MKLESINAEILDLLVKCLLDIEVKHQDISDIHGESPRIKMNHLQNIDKLRKRLEDCIQNFKYMN